MVMKKLILLVVVFGLIFSLCNVASATIITDVERRPPMVRVASPLVEDALSYTDRVHQYNEVPDFLLGADYVMVRNDDRTVANYELDVTTNADGWMYLFIDNRVGDNNAANPPDLTLKMLWVLPMGFVDTDKDIGIDEGGDGSVNNRNSVYKLWVPAGTITLKEQNSGSINMYGVAIPEPTTIALLGFGGLALLRRKRS
jgi:hypothetical protein